MAVEFKPCPAECLHLERERADEAPELFGETKYGFGVICPVCGAATGYFASVPKAIAAWNDRPADTDIAALRAKLDVARKALDNIRALALKSSRYRYGDAVLYNIHHFAHAAFATIDGAQK